MAYVRNTEKVKTMAFKKMEQIHGDNGTAFMGTMEQIHGGNGTNSGFLNYLGYVSEKNKMCM